MQWTVWVVLCILIPNKITFSDGKKYFFYDVYGPTSEHEPQLRLRRDVTPDANNTRGFLVTSTETVVSSASPPVSDEETAIFSDVVDVPDARINETISRGHNLSLSTDHHKYYRSQFLTNNSGFWVDLDDLSRREEGLVQEHPMLSKSYRRAATISLKFQFPFYGHQVQNITIATGGFLYTGEYVHSWLAATQYIAPLMANFDTSQDDRAKIRYADNGTSLIVEWANVYLQSKAQDATHFMEGPFTFQAILHQTGDIVFSYKTIPITITTIEDDEHPVKVGLSDAYIIDRTIFFVRRKTIYEYHRVTLKDEKIANSTAIIFKALTTCNMRKTCQECLEENEFECKWCGKVGRCSDGMDRKRQDWLMKNCDKYSISEPIQCYSEEPLRPIDGAGNEESQKGKQESQKADVPHPAIVTICTIGIIVICLIGWVGYAYFYPHSWSGQLLIKYRPTRWHWRRGEARYTAASIHM